MRRQMKRAAHRWTALEFPIEQFLRGRLLAAAALGLATTTLARLAHLALPLDARLLVETAPLDLLQDAFLRHLLLEDLHRLLKAIANFDFERPAEQVIHFTSPEKETLIYQRLPTRSSSFHSLTSAIFKFYRRPDNGIPHHTLGLCRGKSVVTRRPCFSLSYRQALNKLATPTRGSR